MPRYYFHVRTESGLHPDVEGRECANLPEAIVRGYLSILKACRTPASIKRRLADAIHVTDASGSPLFSLPFSSVVSYLSDMDPATVVPTRRGRRQPV